MLNIKWLLLSIFILFIYCDNIKQQNQYTRKKLKLKIDSLFDGTNFEVNSSIKIKRDSLKITITNVGKNLFYTDAKYQYVHYMMYKLKNIMPQEKKVYKIFVKHKGVRSDRFYVTFSNEELTKFYDSFSSKKTYISFIEYSLNNLDDDDFLEFDIILEDKLRQIVDGLSYSKGFLNMLKEYSSACSKKSKSEKKLLIKGLAYYLAISQKNFDERGDKEKTKKMAHLLDHVNYFLAFCDDGKMTQETLKKLQSNN